MLQKVFGKRLRHLRHISGLTQQGLGELAGVTVEYIGKLERGLSSPSFNVITRLCQALQTEPTNLFLFSNGLDRPTPCSDHAEAEDFARWASCVSGMAIWERDLATNRIHCSDSLLRMLGFEPGSVQVTLRWALRHVHPADRKKVLAAARQHEAIGAVRPMEIRVLRRDNQMRHMLAILEVIHNNGLPVKIMGGLFDITEQKRLGLHLGRMHMDLEEQVRNRTRHLHDTIRVLGEEVIQRKETERILSIYKRMINASTNRIAYLDREGFYRLVNEADAAEHGRSPEDMQGLHMAAVVGRAKYETLIRPNMDKALAGSTVRYQTWQKSKKDGRCCLDVIMTPFGDADGEISGVVCDLRDITDLKQAEEEALAADQAKSRFLATLSHELRNPLNGVLGMLQLLERTDLDDIQQEFLHTAQSSGRGLLGIINDILDLARVESGRLAMESAPMDVRQAVQETLNMFTFQAWDKNLVLQQWIHPDVPALVLGDAGRLKQILANLVGNAVKYTSQGSIRIETDRPVEDALRFTISDTGPGIPESELPHVFEPFVRGHGPSASDVPGAGLGLAIVKRLADLMGGSVTLESREPGATATVVIPAPLARPQEGVSRPRGRAPTDHAPLARPLRILLVEDDPVNRTVIQRFLEMEGHLPMSAGTWAEALELLRRSLFHCVLMDIRLPDMNGLEALRLIRTDCSGDFDPAIPVIAMTASARPDERSRFLAAGMNDVVPKPVEKQDLDEALSRLLPGK